MNEPAMFKALVRFLWIPALLMVLLAFMPRPAHAALKGYLDSVSEGLATRSRARGRSSSSRSSARP